MNNKASIVLSIAAMAILFSILPLNAQLVYHNADRFPLLGKISEQTETRYERLPASLRDVTRPPVWNLGKNTAGLAIRFCSDATSVGVRWDLALNRYMNHMTPTGIKGLDLYCLENGKWMFVNSARPSSNDKNNEAAIISNMKRQEREYMLYLPLYDGITSLEIGIDSGAYIIQPKIDLPTRVKPVVCYGTSILQGGCATRAGMAHTNILNRWFNREFINLGFSGNGQLDYEIAEIMTGFDASLFILDFMPNVNTKQVEEKMEKFYNIIRSKSPDTPVLFIENPIFPQARHDQYMCNEIKEKNDALHVVFDKLVRQGEKNIRLIPFAGAIGNDEEATVDGIHFTDLGFQRYAEYLYPVIKEMTGE